MSSLARNTAAALDWRAIPASSLGNLKLRVLAKHETLTAAAARLGIPFTNMCDVIAGRLHVVWIVRRIQEDQELSNAEVLSLWPLLKTWPKKGRRPHQGFPTK